MKKDFLKELGLSDEQIDSIMSENGKDIKREQEKASKVESERDNYKEQLETAQDTIKGFEGIDVNELQGKISQLTTDLQNKESEFQKQLSDRDFDSLLSGELTGAQAKNIKAVKALLDIESLKSSKNQTEDIKTAITTLKTENDYLFASNEPINNAVLPTNNSEPTLADTKLSALRAAMGLSEK